MNGPHEEAWLDTLLQKQLPSGPEADGFQLQVLDRLPPRERPWHRALCLGATWAVALAVLLLPSGDSVLGAAAVETGNLVVPFSLGTVLLWYLADRLP
jgi:hypothetical protein